MTDWKKIVVGYVERSMTDVFGSSSENAVVYHLKIRGVGIRDAAERPDKFIEALTDIFGVGTEMLEKRFVSDICEALGISSHALRLQEVVEKARSADKKGTEKTRSK